MSAPNYLNGLGSLWCREDELCCAWVGLHLFSAEGQSKTWFPAALGLSQDLPAAVLMMGEERDGERHPNFPEGCQVLGSTEHLKGTGESG